MVGRSSHEIFQLLFETFFNIPKNKRDIPNNINRTPGALYYAIAH